MQGLVSDIPTFNPKNKKHMPISNGIFNYGKLYALPPKQMGGLLFVVLLG